MPAARTIYVIMSHWIGKPVGGITRPKAATLSREEAAVLLARLRELLPDTQIWIEEVHLVTERDDFSTLEMK